MAISNGYTTLAILKAELGIDNTSDDTRLERVIEAVSRFIDRATGQFFYAADAQTRYYTAVRPYEVMVDPLRTVTTFKTDSNDDDTYEKTWDAATFRLEPRNNPVESPARPYTKVRVVSASLPTGRDAIQIVGDFGWAAIPQQVQEACLIQSSRIQKRKDAPFGIAAVPSLDGAGMQIRNLDPDVKQMLAPFMRPSKLGWVA